MRKIVILEGLPKVGKSTLLQKIKSKNLDNVYTVDELFIQRAIQKEATTLDFMANDDAKLACEKDGLWIVDRGPISTLSFNETKYIVDKDFFFDLNLVKEWFLKWIPFLQSDNVVVYYLIGEEQSYQLRYNDSTCPHGTVENQKLMEAISLYNCRKYVKNLTIKQYKYEMLDEVANEIISKFMCS